ncbi:hypothetical protein GW758_00985 [Candidatus Falkowbacteria bacterium]|nr:hypothetical protein [Candidatus Falkowbacteria bacterium]
MSFDSENSITGKLLDEEKPGKERALKFEENKKIELREYRCPLCYKLFFRAKITSALIEIKCRNCKKVARIKSLEF